MMIVFVSFNSIFPGFLNSLQDRETFYTILLSKFYCNNCGGVLHYLPGLESLNEPDLNVLQVAILAIGTHHVCVIHCYHIEER